MLGLPKGSLQREYVVGTWVFMGLYAVSIVAIEVAGDAGRLEGPVLYAAALAPSLFIGGQLRVTLRMLSRLDEFMRALMAKRFIAASAVTFMLATTWGFLEMYAELRHLPAWLVYPTFWGAFGLVTPFIRTSR